MENTSYYRELR